MQNRFRARRGSRGVVLLVLLLLCVMFSGAGPRASTARAAGATLIAAPSTVTAGGATVISGSGFLPNEQIQVFFDGVLKGTVRVLPTGAFGTLLLTVPAGTTPGAHTVQAVGTSSRLSAVAVITVLGVAPAFAAQLSLSPSTVTAGGKVVIGGSGFVPGETVLLRLNGTLVASMVADGSGTFGGYVLTLPAGTAPGAYSVTAAGATSNAQASAALTVIATAPSATAALSLNPRAALRGSRVEASGVGFVPGELVLITVNSAVVASATADAGGAFVRAGFVVPAALGKGPAAVLAFGSTSRRSAAAVLTVLAVPTSAPARLAISPAETVPSGRVTLSGSGFKAHEIILVRIDGAFAFSKTADAGGAFRIGYTASLGYGTHTLAAEGASSERKATATLVIGRPAQAGMHLIPNRTHRGEVIRVAGINFLPGETVLMRFRGAIVQSATASSEGVINASFTIPGRTPLGVSEVTLQGARSGRTAQAPIGILRAPAGRAGIRLSTTKPRRGATIMVSGHGFQAGEVVLIRFRGKLVQSARADGKGSFARAPFVVGVHVPVGSSTVEATGSNSGRDARMKVKVSASAGAKPTATLGIKVSPTSLKFGTRVMVTGHGFQGGEFVVIRLRGVIVQAVQADTRGNFRTSFAVPSRLKKGAATLEVSGARTNRHAGVKVVIG